MKFPEGWKVLSNEELYYRDNKGLSYIDENQEKDIESPAWHKDILEKRLEKIEKNEVKYISLDELKRLCI